MKYLIFLLVFLWSATLLYAERFDVPYATYVPRTPFSGLFLEKRIMASKVVYHNYDANGEIIIPNNGNCTNNYETNYTIYRHDPGGLIDTIDGGGCVNIPQILKYAPDGKLKSWEFLSGTFTDFEYDNLGRILSITSGYNRSTIHEYGKITLYDYKENTITIEDRYDGEITFNICRINYNDSGYVATYEDGSKIEYIYDNQNRLIRGGDILYI